MRINEDARVLGDNYFSFPIDSSVVGKPLGSLVKLDNGKLKVLLGTDYVGEDGTGLKKTDIYVLDAINTGMNSSTTAKYDINGVESDIDMSALNNLPYVNVLPLAGEVRVEGLRHSHAAQAVTRGDKLVILNGVLTKAPATGVDAKKLNILAYVESTQSSAIAIAPWNINCVSASGQILVNGA